MASRPARDSRSRSYLPPSMPPRHTPRGNPTRLLPRWQISARTQPGFTGRPAFVAADLTNDTPTLNASLLKYSATDILFTLSNSSPPVPPDRSPERHTGRPQSRRDRRTQWPAPNCLTKTTRADRSDFALAGFPRPHPTDIANEIAIRPHGDIGIPQAVPLGDPLPDGAYIGHPALQPHRTDDSGVQTEIIHKTQPQSSKTPVMAGPDPPTPGKGGTIHGRHSGLRCQVKPRP